MSKVRIELALLTAACCCATSMAQTQAEETLHVWLANQRHFQGTIDGSSDDHQLMLRTAKEGMTVFRPLSWQRINRAELDGNSVEVAKLIEMATARNQTRGSKQAPGVRRIELRGPAAPEPLETTPAIEPGPLPQVVTVSFDAYVANWDADVETDGLVVDIIPIDADGLMAQVDGTVQIELLAPQRRVFHHAPLSGGDTLALVERWTRSITAEDFGRSGVRLRLPFGAVHPEIDYDWLAWWYGLVHVQVAIPGHGVFEDSRDGIRIRPWAPNRDNLEMNAGRRFVPTERAGRRD
jgi:hypothetical protein